MSSIEERLDRLNEKVLEATAGLRRSREMLSKVETMVRNAALEEAAKVVEADKGWRDVNQRIAAAIRALKEATDA